MELYELQVGFLSSDLSYLVHNLIFEQIFVIWYTYPIFEQDDPLL